jgi:DNA-binding transcriptional regulator YhcF (GntR family)
MISDDSLIDLRPYGSRRDAHADQAHDRSRSTETESEADRTIRSRWGGDERLISEGWLGVPRLFFITVAALGLTPAETAFVLHLMSFKWSKANPFPSHRLLANRLGVSPKQIQKYARQLEEKGLLRRIARREEATGDRTSNAFDLQPLFDSMVRVSKEMAITGRKYR